MSFLMRIALPDVPGSLGMVATALGAAGADIEAIEIIERRADATVVDDVLLQLPPTVMPDALVTACHALDGVNVEWISRYTAGTTLALDLETVESFVQEPRRAVARMIELLPLTFRADWAMAIGKGPEVLHASDRAPDLVPESADWLDLSEPRILDPVDGWSSTVLAASPATDTHGVDFVVIIGRHGGPSFLASEVARLGHMVALAASVTPDR